ncbi:MAG: stalk domain-containing protein [Anaeromicrobium sp.]|uniref:stalk domain-containing protein n=1 Tax=Anaeromicrobium sp. TaxID=1929132 RepID=UPI0025E7C7CE|nr:stalk domain-containing protein [Anaeromicrobium sp.]MCT4594256.1 stalk domain-containing protein [Anaeromicrobium sp.]
MKRNTKKISSWMVAFTLLLNIVFIPINKSYASSDNSVNRIPKVKIGHKFTDPNTATILKIEDDEGDFANEEEIILKLENAKWLNNDDFENSTFEETMKSYMKNNSLCNTHTGFSIERDSDSTVYATVYNAVYSDDLLMKIPMLVESLDEGEMGIKIESKSGVVTEERLPIGVAATKGNIITNDDMQVFIGEVTLDEIEIREILPGSLPTTSNGKISMKLPQGFEWIKRGILEISEELEGATEIINIDGDTLEITIDYSKAKSRDLAGDIILREAAIKATPKASPGEVIITVSGDNLIETKLFAAFYNEVINFPDKNLESAIRNIIDKLEGEIYSWDVRNVKRLYAIESNISNLKGIEYLVNLKYLNLSNNKITDITHLSALKELEYLGLEDNKIKNIEPLNKLDNLRSLYLGNNPIEDYSPVAGYYEKLANKDFSLKNKEETTIVTIVDTITFADPTKIEEIEITEKSKGAINVSNLEYIELELTKDFGFYIKDGVYGNITGDFVKNIDGKSNGTIKAAHIVPTSKPNVIKIRVSHDPTKVDEALIVENNIYGIGNLELNNFHVSPTSHAKEGKVELKINSNMDEIKDITLEVGEYAEYKVTVKADGDVAQVHNNGETYKLTKLVIEEGVNRSWEDNRSVIVELPEWVKIIRYDFDGDPVDKGSVSVDENEIEFSVNKDEGLKKVELTLYVSVQTVKEGLIEAVVSGRALDAEKFKAVIGKVLNTDKEPETAIVTIEDTITFSEPTKIEEIEITEKSEGSINVSNLEYIELELTKDFKFYTKDGVYGNITGNFVKNIDGKSNGTIKEAHIVPTSKPNVIKIRVSHDPPKVDEALIVENNISGIGNFELNNFYVNATRYAKEGKVELKINSNMDEIKDITLEVGEYADYKVTVKADGDVAQVYNNGETYKLAKLVIEEGVDRSWDNVKEVIVKLPEWVKIIRYDFTGDPVDEGSVSIDENEIEFSVNKDEGLKKVELTLYVSVQTVKEGLIEAVVSGRALGREEFKAVIGKVLNTVESKPSNTASSSGGGGGGGGGPQPPKVDDKAHDKAIEKALNEEKEIKLSLKDTKEPKAKISLSVLKKVIDAHKPLKIENKGITIGFSKSFLPIEKLKESGKDASLQIAAIAVEKTKKYKILSKVLKNTDFSQVGSEVFELSCDIVSEKGTTKVSSFNEPVAITIDLSNEKLSKEEIDNLTGIRYEKDEKGDVTPIKLGGTYDSNTKTFTFYTDQLSLHGALEVEDLRKINLTIDDTYVNVNNKPNVLDLPPTIMNNRTMVPLRFVAEALGTNVEWIDETKTVKLELDNKELSLVIGEKQPGMDVPAVIKNGRTLVPIRYVSENLGANVLWFQSSQRIEIVK